MGDGTKELEGEFEELKKYGRKIGMIKNEGEWNSVPPSNNAIGSARARARDVLINTKREN